MKVERDIPTLNLISFVAYYGANVIGLLIFILVLIPVRLIFGFVFPTFFKSLGANITAYIEEKQKQVHVDWDRLSTIDIRLDKE